MIYKIFFFVDDKSGTIKEVKKLLREKTIVECPNISTNIDYEKEKVTITVRFYTSNMPFFGGR